MASRRCRGQTGALALAGCRRCCFQRGYPSELCDALRCSLCGELRFPVAQVLSFQFLQYSDASIDAARQNFSRAPGVGEEDACSNARLASHPTPHPQICYVQAEYAATCLAGRTPALQLAERLPPDLQRSSRCLRAVSMAFLFAFSLEEKHQNAGECFVFDARAWRSKRRTAVFFDRHAPSKRTEEIEGVQSSAVPGGTRNYRLARVLLVKAREMVGPARLG